MSRAAPGRGLSSVPCDPPAGDWPRGRRPGAGAQQTGLQAGAEVAVWQAESRHYPLRAPGVMDEVAARGEDTCGFEESPCTMPCFVPAARGKCPEGVCGQSLQ